MTCISHSYKKQPALPSEGWGSQFLGNPRSLSRFLPEKLIKKLPPQAENSLEQGNSTTSSQTSGSSLLEDSSNQKQPCNSGQDQFSDKKVKFEETLATADFSDTSVPSLPAVNLTALEALQKSGAIKVIFPRSLQNNNVSSQTQLPENPENKFSE